MDKNAFTELLKKYFSKEYILGLLKGYALKALTGLAGWRLTLAKHAMRYGWKYVDQAVGATMAYATKIYNDIKNKYLKKRDQKDAAKYEETLKDGVSEDDQKNSTTDLLN